MKLEIRIAVMLVAMGCGTGALAAVGEECSAPAEPTGVADGAAATMEEMVGAQQEMKAYMEKGNEYIACMDAIEQALPEDTDVKDRAALIEQRNKMVDSMEAVAERFNTAVRAFKAKGQ
jgi:hypothetical protein